MRIWLALRVFFAALFNVEKAQRLERALAAVPAAEPAPPSRPAEVKPLPAAKVPTRSEALTLLAALQREARLLDIIHEPLASYSDSEIGAASRDVLRNCAGVLERWFGLQPLLAQEDGAVVEVPAGYDPQKYRLVGNVAGQPPFRGQLVHHGWLATKCELPAWSGSVDTTLVVAPVEVEVGA